MSGFLGGGSTTTTDTHKQVTLDPNTQWFLENYINQAFGSQDNLNNLGQFGGPAVTPPPSDQWNTQWRGMDLINAISKGQYGDLSNTLTNAIATARGDFLDPSTNPYLPGLIDATVRPLDQKFKEQTIPFLRGNASAPGSFDNLRRSMLESQATRDYNTNVSDVTAKLLSQNYQNERQNQVNAASQIQNSIKAMLTPTAAGQDIANYGQKLQDFITQNALAMEKIREHEATRVQDALSKSSHDIIYNPAQTTDIHTRAKSSGGSFLGDLLGLGKGLVGIGTGIADIMNSDNGLGNMDFLDGSSGSSGSGGWDPWAGGSFDTSLNLFG